MSVAALRMKRHLPPPDAITRNVLRPEHWARCEVTVTITAKNKNTWAGEQVFIYAPDLEKDEVKYLYKYSGRDGQSLFYIGAERDRTIFKVLEVFDPLKTKCECLKDYVFVLRMAKRLEKQKFLEGTFHKNFHTYEFGIKEPEGKVLIYDTDLSDPYRPQLVCTSMRVKGIELEKKINPCCIKQRGFKPITKEELLTCENELVRLLAHSDEAKAVAKKLQELKERTHVEVSKTLMRINGLLNTKWQIIRDLSEELKKLLPKEEYNDCLKTLEGLARLPEEQEKSIRDLHVEFRKLDRILATLLLERGWRRNDLC